MATIKKTIEWISAAGNNVEITIECTKGMRDCIAYADGHNIKTGVETYEHTNIAIEVNGKSAARSYFVRTYIKQELYDIIMALLAEIDAELTTDVEYAEVKAAEDAKVARQEAADKAAISRRLQHIKNGLCPKCGTWCYGDCSS